MQSSPRLVVCAVLWAFSSYAFSTALADGPPRGLSESYCKAKTTRAAVLAAMNRQGLRNVRIKPVRFEYLERVRRDEFCAFTAVGVDGLEHLFAAFRTVTPRGDRFRFKFLD